MNMCSLNTPYHNNPNPLTNTKPSTSRFSEFSAVEIEVSEILLRMTKLISASNQKMVRDLRHHQTAKVGVKKLDRVDLDNVPDLNMPVSLEED